MGAEPIVPWSPGRRAEVSRVDTALWGVAARPEGLGEEGIWKALGPPLLSSRSHPSPQAACGWYLLRRPQPAETPSITCWGLDPNASMVCWGAGVGRPLHVSGGGWSPEPEITQGLLQDNAA